MSYPWAYSDPIDGEGMDDEDRGAPYPWHVDPPIDYDPCMTCYGRGGTLERQDPVGDGLGFETFLNYCPDCLEECRCPGCGLYGERVTDIEAVCCERCGWTFDIDRFYEGDEP